MRNNLGPIVLAVLLCAVAATAFAAPAPEECAGCHEDVVKSFAGTIHGRTFEARTHKSANCLSCHIGAQEHAQSGGEQKPVSLKHGDQASTPCLSCHETNGKAHWQGSAHQRAGVACASCHDVHAAHGGTPGPKSTVGKPGEKTQKCLSCHGAQRAALHQRSSHPLREGQMECSSCHDPHGTSNERLLRQGNVNELCYTCHQNLRGPFLWEHSPVREDCLTCHRAHGSNYQKLLVARTAQLCQSCHQQGRHQTLPGTRSSVWNNNRACANCHSQVHGTNHPSGPLFQR